MRNTLISLMSIMAAGAVFADAYTDTDAADNHGKIGLKKLTADIDANFALVEGGNVKSTTASVTNGQEVTLSAQVTILSGIGQASGSTNTITLATPYTADRIYILTLASGATNDVLIADNGTTVSLGANVVLEPTDTLTLLATDTNKMVKVSASGSN